MPALCRQRASMPLVPGHMCLSRLLSSRPFALPHAHECATAVLASLLCTMPSSRFPSLLATNGMVPPIGGVFLPQPVVHTPHDPCLAAPSYRSHPSSAPLLTVKSRQPSHEFTFGVGMSFIPYPLVLTPVV
jgi:hypothetical protein